MITSLARFRQIAVGRRTAWLVALLPIILAAVLIGGVGEAERERTPLDTLPRDADSTLAAELSEQLPDQDSSVALVLFTADDGGTLEQSTGDLEQLVGRLIGEFAGSGDAPAEQGQGGEQGGPPLVVSDDGTAAIGVVPVTGESSTATADAVESLRDQLDDLVPSGVEAQVTGPAGIQADLASVFAGADTRLLLFTALVVSVLLIVTYRSPFLWLVPLTVIAVADRLAVTLATHTLATFDIAWDESTVGILSVLVFGAGSNYALLLISRYRDELRRSDDRREAMATSLRHTAEAVLTSAGTVVAGVLTLLLSLTPTTRGLGLACAVGILVAAVFVLLVLPAALVCFGRWIFWPRAPRAGEGGLNETRTLWRRVGDTVARKPVVALVAAGVFLSALALGTTRISTGLDTAEQFLDTPEAITAADRIAESFPAGATEPTQVVTRAEGERLEQLVAALGGVDGVSSAQPSASGNGVTQIEVTLTSAPGTTEAADTVAALREAIAPTADEVDTHVGGAAATSVDEEDGEARDRVLILPLILLLVLVSLMGLLRSVVGPLILVSTVVVTYVAAMGAAWWVFTGVLGFESLAGTVPLFAFLFLVALGIDYNIFLITRTREEAVGHGSRQGVLRALGATGGVITSAGILLASVFAVLGVLPLVVLAQLGVVIFIGVLLDTLLVRTVVVPAIVLLLGERFWWPRRVAAAQE